MNVLKSLSLAALSLTAALPALAEGPRALSCQLHEICGETGCHAPDADANLALSVAIDADQKATLTLGADSYTLENVKPAPVWRWRGTDAEGKIHVFAWREEGGQATYLKINVDDVEVKASGECLGE